MASKTAAKMDAESRNENVTGATGGEQEALGYV